MEILQDAGEDEAWIADGDCGYADRKIPIFMKIFATALIIHSLLGIRFFLRSHWRARSVIACLVLGIIIVRILVYAYLFTFHFLTYWFSVCLAHRLAHFLLFLHIFDVTDIFVMSVTWNMLCT